MRMPLPAHTSSASFSTNVGTVVFDEKSKEATWTIGKLPRETSPSLSGSVTLEPGSSPPPPHRPRFVVHAPPLTHSLTHSPTCSLTYSPTCSLTYFPTCSLTNARICSLTYFVTYFPTCSLTCHLPFILERSYRA